VCSIEQRRERLITKLFMAMTDRARLRWLVLQIERDLSTHAQLNTLLAAAAGTIEGRRRDLRNLKARIARRSLQHARQERNT